MKTKVINFISGPGAGKSVMAAYLFAELKCLGKCTELVQEYPKTLVWQKRFMELNDQYMVSHKQYLCLKSMNEIVEYIVFDSSLILGIIYNKENNNNISDKYKTEEMIWEKTREFNNIFIFIERDSSIKFEKDGRIHTELESMEIDTKIKDLLREKNIPYFSCKSGKDSINDVIDYIAAF